MKNTERYFDTIKGFVGAMTDIVNRYDAEVKRLDSFKGSAGYEQRVRDAATRRDDEVRQARETYWGQLGDTIQKMRDAVANRPMVAPTPEQAALLSVLNMRTSLSRDELERAARQMGDCPMGLSVLDDLATKHKASGEKFNQELSLAWLTNKIDVLKKSGEKIIQSGINAANTRTPDDCVGCLERHGRFWQIQKPGEETSRTDVARITSFSAAVDG